MILFVFIMIIVEYVYRCYRFQSVLLIVDGLNGIMVFVGLYQKYLVRYKGLVCDGVWLCVVFFGVVLRELLMVVEYNVGCVRCNVLVYRSGKFNSIFGRGCFIDF